MTTLGADSLQTVRNTPKGIRIFLNDVICAPQRTGISVFKPEKGTFSTVAYSGSLKNTIYIYTPPKDTRISLRPWRLCCNLCGSVLFRTAF